MKSVLLASTEQTGGCIGGNIDGRDFLGCVKVLCEQVLRAALLRSYQLLFIRPWSEPGRCCGKRDLRVSLSNIDSRSKTTAQLDSNSYSLGCFKFRFHISFADTFSTASVMNVVFAMSTDPNLGPRSSPHECGSEHEVSARRG